MVPRYESVVRKLYQVNMWQPVKLGLENSEALHKLIGFPMRSKPIIHVAGTNGKGSVSFKIARALRAAGYRDGLFVSPHVSSFRERLQVGGELISEAEVVESLPWIFKLCEDHDVPATFFEVATALAFHHFRNADAVVLEVGLGGRLDSTNVIIPRVSVITSIGLDHTKVLGDTIEAIATEKAGIMKHGVPVVVGPRAPVSVLAPIAREKGVSEFLVTPSPGAGATFDDENSAIARAVLELLQGTSGFERLDEGAILEGLSSRPPCRFEVLDARPATTHEPAAVLPANAAVAAPAGWQRVVLDVGHNPPALEECVKMAKRVLSGKRLRLVLGMSQDKDVGECLDIVLNTALGLDVSHCHFVAASHPRAAPPSALLRAALERGVDAMTFCTAHEGDESVAAGVHAALKHASSDEVVLIAGSVFIMSDAREALGFDEPRDSPIIREVAGKHLKSSQESFPPDK